MRVAEWTIQYRIVDLKQASEWVSMEKLHTGGFMKNNKSLCLTQRARVHQNNEGHAQSV